MENLEYKGFIGSAEISINDNILHGKLLHIDGLITYEAETPAQLIEEFHNAVDDYLEFCEQNNLQPQKTYNGVFSVRTSPENHKTLSYLASKHGKTLNSVVNNILTEYITQKEERKFTSKEVARLIEFNFLSNNQKRTTSEGIEWDVSAS